MVYQVNLTWAQARDLALAGAMVRRIGWLDRWLFSQGGLWWMLPLVGAPWVVRANDFGRAEFLAADFTTTLPEQYHCFPSQPNLWVGCKQVELGASKFGGSIAHLDVGGVTSSFPWVSSLMFPLVFGGLGTATIRGVAAGGTGAGVTAISINGRSVGRVLPGSIHINVPEVFVGVDSLEVVISASEGPVSASFYVCFSVADTEEPEPPEEQPEAGGPVEQLYQFRTETNMPGGGYYPNAPRFGERAVSNPFAAAAKVWLHGFADDVFRVRLPGSTIWQAVSTPSTADPNNTAAVDFRFVLPSGAAFSIAASNEGGGPCKYNVTGIFEL